MSNFHASIGNRLLSLVVMFALVACGGGSEGPAGTPTSGDIASASIADGNFQVATVATDLPRPLIAVLLDGAGQVVAGKGVSFVVTVGSGTVFAGFAVSDAKGVVRERWTLGTKSGTQKLELRAVDATGAARTYATFEATATAATPKAITLISGDGQNGVQLQQLTAPIEVRVTDEYLNPVSGTRISFNSNDGGTAAPASVTTNAQGLAQTMWSLGAPIGLQTLIASTPGLTPATFTAISSSSEPRVKKVSGDSQTVAQYSFTSQPISVMVTLPDGRPCNGCEVLFSKTASNGVRMPSVFSNEAGIATLPPGYAGSPFSEPNVSGLYFGLLGQQTVTATVLDLGSVTFNVNVVQNPRFYDGLFTCITTGYGFNMIVSGENIVTLGGYIGSTSSAILNEVDGSLAGAAMVFTPNTPFGINIIGRITIDADQQGLASGTYTIDAAFGLPPGVWSCNRQK